MVQLERNVFQTFLEETVFDEKKIITYKGLSRALDSSYHNCHRELTDFFESHKKEHEDGKLFAIYYFSGVREKDLHSHRIKLIRAEDVEKARAIFDKVSSCHVYALLPNYPLDLSGVFAADYEAEKKTTFEEEIRHGAVSNMTEEEFEKTRTVKRNQTVPIVPPKPETVPKPEAKASVKTVPSKAPVKSDEQKPTTTSNLRKDEESTTAPAPKPVEPKKAKGKKADIGAMLMSAKPKPRPPPAKETEEEPIRKHKKVAERDEKDKKGGKKRKNTRVMVESDSEDDIFSTASTPEKFAHSPRRSPRKHSTTPSPEKPVLTKTRAAPKKKPTKKAQEKQPEPMECDAADDDNEEEEIPPTPSSTKSRKKVASHQSSSSEPSSIQKKQDKISQSLDEDGFMVVHKTKEIVKEKVIPPPRPEANDPASRGTSSKSKESAPVAKGKSKQDTTKKQHNLLSFFNKK